MLKRLIEKHGITQQELAAGIGRSEGYVSRLVSENAGASQGTIDALLVFLTGRLRRKVTYEMVFGAPSLVESEPLAKEGR